RTRTSCAAGACPRRASGCRARRRPAPTGASFRRARATWRACGAWSSAWSTVSWTPALAAERRLACERADSLAPAAPARVAALRRGGAWRAARRAGSELRAAHVAHAGIGAGRRPGVDDAGGAGARETIHHRARHGAGGGRRELRRAGGGVLHAARPQRL